MNRIFLCYARADRDQAKALYDELSAAPDTHVWFDEVDLIPGTRWKPAIRKAIRESRFFVALLSKRASTTRGYRHSELRQAIEIMEEFPDDYIFVIPTRLEDCEPPVDFLKDLTYADLFPEWDTGVANLKRTLTSAPTRHKAAPLASAASRKVADRLSVDPDSASASRPRMSDYYYQIGLVDLDVELRELASVARGLNRVQRLFHLRRHQLKSSRKALQSREGLPQLYVDELSQQFYDQIAPLKIDHAVCITNRLLMFDQGENVFWNYLGAVSQADERVAFSSIRGLDEYAGQADVSYEAALAYLLVSEFTSYFLNLEYHDAIRECPLDFTEDHSQMVGGLRKGRFCRYCVRKLNSNPDLRDAVTAMLEWGR